MALRHARIGFVTGLGIIVKMMKARSKPIMSSHQPVTRMRQTLLIIAFWAWLNHPHGQPKKQLVPFCRKEPRMLVPSSTTWEHSSDDRVMNRHLAAGSKRRRCRMRWMMHLGGGLPYELGGGGLGTLCGIR